MVEGITTRLIMSVGENDPPSVNLAPQNSWASSTALVLGSGLRFISPI